MAEDEVWHPQDVLQTDSASRKLWLVKVRALENAIAAATACPHPRGAIKQCFCAHLGPLQVPNFVAKRWKACCEQSVERGEATGRKLATLRLVKSTDETGAAKTEYQLQLDGACACL
jgi:hypothetical protein